MSGMVIGITAVIILLVGLVFLLIGMYKRDKVYSPDKEKWLTRYRKVTNNKVKDEELEKIYEHKEGNMFGQIGSIALLIGMLTLLIGSSTFLVDESDDKLNTLANGVCMNDLNSKLMPSYGEGSNIELTDTELTLNCYSGYITYPLATVQK